MIDKSRLGLHHVLAMVSLIFVFNHAVEAKPGTHDKRVRNVILLIADGTGVAHFTLARWYQGGMPLAADEWTCGLLRTYAANTPLTDSAPAASAFATGFKTFSGFVSVLPAQASMYGIDPGQGTDIDNRPLVTVLEAARLAGKATGIVVTCEIPHATPAAFSAHRLRRKDFEAIAEQQVYNGIDVVLAGGAMYLDPRHRRDGEDLTAVLRQKGYRVVRTRDELFADLNGRVWGLFAEQEMANDLDRNPGEPSLAEMTARALTVLDRNKRGFFLMVEGSKIDWAAHDNEPVGVVSEVLAFNRAVRTAIDFARRDGDTAVIIVSDHGCGGLSIGDRQANSLNERPGISAIVEPLRRARHTAAGVENELLAAAGMDRDKVRTLISREYGLELSPEDLTRVMNYFAGRQEDQYELATIIGPILSRAAYLGWTTDGHTGEDVPFSIFHPRGYRLSGVVQNTAVAWYIDEILDLNLAAWNNILYLPAAKAFADKGAVSVVEETQTGNPVLVVSKGAQILRLPANKNQADVNGRTMQLRTLIVHNGRDFFVPREVLDLIK